MQPPIFFASSESVIDDMVELDVAESRHAKVMRLKPNDQVIVIDGLGNACRGEIAKMTGRSNVQITVRQQMRNFGEPSVRLTLAAGLSASYKFDQVVQRGTELGVKRFVPILSEKSKVKLDSDTRIRSRLRRLEKVALAAVKQCRRSYRPEISLPLSLADFLTETDPESANLLFHSSQKGQTLETVEFSDQIKRVSILIGPEAGFSPEELELALGSGFQQISLGSRILRTETAGPVACALVMQLLGELR